jgi:hypothetical protein
VLYAKMGWETKLIQSERGMFKLTKRDDACANVAWAKKKAKRESEMNLKGVFVDGERGFIFL